MVRLILIPQLFLVITTTALAAVASSTNYQIQFDSINIGGATSSSATYQIRDTVGETVSGTSTSATYRIKAGFQLMATSTYLTISSPANVTLPRLTEGVGQSNGSISWTVTASHGYTLAIKASTNPAFKVIALSGQGTGSQQFNDYTSGDPIYGWSVSSDASAFGFNPVSADLINTYKDNGISCGTGSNTGNCWDGFSTVNQTVASAATGPKNTVTTINLRAEVGSSFQQRPAIYRATLTATAAPA